MTDASPALYPGTDLPVVAFQRITQSEIDMVAAWLADDKARCWLDLGGGRQSASRLQIYSMLTGGRTHARLFGLPGQPPIGLICLNDYDNLMGTAEVWGLRGVYQGGPPNLAVASFLAILATGFLDLDREVIGSWVVSINQLSILMHQRLGLTEVGRPRGRHVINGKRYDRVLFDMTREEFGACYPDVPSEGGITYRQWQQAQEHGQPADSKPADGGTPLAA